jgi:hypothetical protein
VLHLCCLARSTSTGQVVNLDMQSASIHSPLTAACESECNEVKDRSRVRTFCSFAQHAAFPCNHFYRTHQQTYTLKYILVVDRGMQVRLLGGRRS